MPGGPPVFLFFFWKTQSWYLTHVLFLYKMKKCKKEVKVTNNRYTRKCWGEVWGPGQEQCLPQGNVHAAYQSVLGRGQITSGDKGSWPSSQKASFHLTSLTLATLIPCFVPSYLPGRCPKGMPLAYLTPGSQRCPSELLGENCRI